MKQFQDPSLSKETAHADYDTSLSTYDGLAWAGQPKFVFRVRMPRGQLSVLRYFSTTRCAESGRFGPSPTAVFREVVLSHQQAQQQQGELRR
jgi:hypothetical protein